MSAHHISGVGFSFWPGVSATRYGSSQNEGKVPHDRPSRGTPSIDTMARNWQTPTASASRGGAQPVEERVAGGHAINLQDQAVSWPTPTVDGNRNSSEYGERPPSDDDLPTRVQRTWPTAMAADGMGRSGAYVRGNHTLSLAAKLWPTATASDSRAGGARNTDGSKAHQGTSLSDAVLTGSSSSGRRGRASAPGGPMVLNPQFVEWLMGFPIGWTDCAPWATESFLAWRRRHSRSLSGER